VLEEALLAFGAGKPTYLIGAFGGVTAKIIEARRTGASAALTLDYQVDAQNIRGRDYRTLVELYRQQQPEGAPDYASACKQLHDADLHNGLDAAENDRLFRSANITEIVALVLKGLRAVAHA
jgi:hypothetical protein